MRNPRLPSLDLLRGFEAAARHMSFTRAASELNVTQSAVSRQIKTLEDHLGVPLFRRHSLKTPADLAHHVLLHLEDPQGEWPWLTWREWLTALKIPELKPAGALHFSHYDQLVRAAIEAEGVALGRAPMIERFLGT